MKLQDYFDKIYCINLATRTDRWAECLVEFDKHKIHGVQRILGVNGIPAGFKSYGSMGLKPHDGYRAKLAGRVGCLLSHLSVIKRAKEEGVRRMLLLEDDVQFVSDLENVFTATVTDVPDDWTLLYLGGNEKDVQIKITENVLRVSRMLMGHAIGIDCRIFDLLIELLSKCEVPVDAYYSVIQKDYPSYAIYPYLAWQRASWSDIEQRFMILKIYLPLLPKS